MSLDDVYLSQRELLLRDRERDWADRKADMDEQRLCESVEAMETYWDGVMRQGQHSIHADQTWDGT